MADGRIPYGLRVIRVLAYFALIQVSIGFILFLLAAIMGQKSPQVAPFISSLISSRVNSQLFVLIPSVITTIAEILAISRRSRTAYFIATAGLIILAVTGVVSSIGVTKTLGIGMLLTFLPAIFLDLYWILMNSYFLNPSFTADSPLARRLDSFVNPALIISAVILLGGLFYSSAALLNTAKEAEQKKQVYLNAFANLSFKERNAYCLSQPKTPDRDLCLFAGFEYTKNKGNITIESCNLITSEGLRGTCYAMIGECDSIREESMKKLCELAKKSASPTTSPQ